MRALREHGALSRAESCERAKLPLTTTSEITSFLLERRAIVAVRQREAIGRGRPAERLAIDPEAGLSIGIDFRHGQVPIAVPDASHESVANGKHAYPTNTSRADRAKIAFKLLESL